MLELSSLRLVTSSPSMSESEECEFWFWFQFREIMSSGLIFFFMDGFENFCGENSLERIILKNL